MASLMSKSYIWFFPSGDPLPYLLTKCLRLPLILMTNQLWILGFYDPLLRFDNLLEQFPELSKTPSYVFWLILRVRWRNGQMKETHRAKHVRGAATELPCPLQVHLPLNTSIVHQPRSALRVFIELNPQPSSPTWRLRVRPKYLTLITSSSQWSAPSWG